MEKLQDWIAQAENKLCDAGIYEAKNDAWLLWEFVSGMSKTRYLLERNCDAALWTELKGRYQQVIERRAKREPLQHITGSQYFYGYEFQVSPAVLVPRMDTEVLVYETLEKIRRYEKREIKCLDMCTGSGCIAITLKKEAEKAGKNLCMTAVDLSWDALKVAQQNAKKMECEIHFIQSNLFEKLDKQEKFDFIVSNPPYIPTEVIKTLSEEVKQDPLMALDGDGDGLRFYREITAQAEEYLEDDGFLLYEIGHDQAEDVKHLMEKEFTDIIIKKDLAGLDRVMSGRRKER